MDQRVLIVEGSSLPRQDSLSHVLTPAGGFRCERADWETLQQKRLDQLDMGLIVAVADPLTAKVTEVFESFRTYPIVTPTLAVLPSDADEGLCRLASEIAADFILSPPRVPELRQRIARILAPESVTADTIRDRLTDEMGLAQLVGCDPTFTHAIRQLGAFAQSDLPVLITGETGTGKELCAHGIHHLSPRRHAPFIVCDCAAVPDQLFENELFGHARGAFTDAHADRHGLIALAEGGTLFLDEIDALSLAAQAKLLRFLEERTFRPLGSQRFQHADVNIIAASNRDLEVRVREREFRTDLYFRLNVMRMHLPPLRHRPGDIGLLARHFLATSDPHVSGATHKFLSHRALHMLTQYDWPGNVRELLHVIQRAAVRCDTAQILPHHIVLPHIARPVTDGTHLTEARATFERSYLAELLRKHNGNITRAAFEAGKERHAFRRLIKRYERQTGSK